MFPIRSWKVKILKILWTFSSKNIENLAYIDEIKSKRRFYLLYLREKQGIGNKPPEAKGRHSSKKNRRSTKLIFFIVHSWSSLTESTKQKLITFLLMINSDTHYAASYSTLNFVDRNEPIPSCHLKKSYGYAPPHHLPLNEFVNINKRS